MKLKPTSRILAWRKKAMHYWSEEQFSSAIMQLELPDPFSISDVINKLNKKYSQTHYGLYENGLIGRRILPRIMQYMIDEHLVSFSLTSKKCSHGNKLIYLYHKLL